MTAPDTDVEKQARRHRPSLIGIFVAAVLAVILMVVVSSWPGEPLDDEPLPDATVPAETQIDQ